MSDEKNKRGEQASEPEVDRVVVENHGTSEEAQADNAKALNRDDAEAVQEQAGRKAASNEQADRAESKAAKPGDKRTVRLEE
jgi:hypothetical protein